MRDILRRDLGRDNLALDDFDLVSEGATATATPAQRKQKKNILTSA